VLKKPAWPRAGNASGIVTTTARTIVQRIRRRPPPTRVRKRASPGASRPTAPVRETTM
jgi:hypothetical protein